MAEYAFKFDSVEAVLAKVLEEADRQQRTVYLVTFPDGTKDFVDQLTFEQFFCRVDDAGRESRQTQQVLENEAVRRRESERLPRSRKEPAPGPHTVIPAEPERRSSGPRQDSKSAAILQKIRNSPGLTSGELIQALKGVVEAGDVYSATRFYLSKLLIEKKPNQEKGEQIAWYPVQRG